MTIAVATVTGCSHATCADYHDPNCWSPAPPSDASPEGDALDDGSDDGEALDAAETGPLALDDEDTTTREASE